ncbi:MAG: DUF3048 domain-containing protein [Acidimicrobiia bacterium]
MRELLARRPKLVAAVAAAVVLLGGGAAVLALSGGGDDAAPPTTTTTTTVAPTTTTTTEPPTTTTTTTVPAYPLTGLPVVDPARATQPALVVKIDNAQPSRGQGARPQWGLNQADVVFEEMVEGSVTRFAAVFHSTDADPVGPIRSARTTDLMITGSLNGPLFAWSGANAGVAEQVRAADLVDIGHSAASSAYRREGSRPAPHNLVSSTAALRAAVAPEVRPPVPHFAYRPEGTPVQGAPAGGVGIVFGDGPGSAPVDFTWNGTGWARSQAGTPHVDAAGVQVAPANVVVLFAPYVEVQCCDASGYPVMEAQMVGDGDAWILTAGNLVPARWHKGSLAEPTSYLDAAGQPVLLTPGQTWVSIAPPGTATPH